MVVSIVLQDLPVVHRNLVLKALVLGTRGILNDGTWREAKKDGGRSVSDQRRLDKVTRNRKICVNLGT